MNDNSKREIFKSVNRKYRAEVVRKTSRITLLSVVMYHIRYDIYYLRNNKCGSFSRPFALRRGR